MREYEVVWRAALIVARGDIATFVAQPSFEPEAAALISSVNGKEDAYVLTCAFADEQIGLRPIDPTGRVPAGSPISIRRIDVPLSGRIANAVGAAWRAMLRLPRREAECCKLDGEPTIYSALDDRAGELSGRAHNPEGGRSAEIEYIGKLLLQYCKATPDERAELDAELQSRSQSLIRATWLEHLTKRWSGP